MFLTHDITSAAGGGAGAVAAPWDRLRHRLSTVEWVPDLGARIGSRTWWRGCVTCTVLIAAAILTAPGIRPVPGALPAPLAGSDWEEARALAVAPLALGGTTGRRMAANDLVRPLAETPERPLVELTATLGARDDLSAALRRAGVGRGDAAIVARLIAADVATGDVPAGTVLDLTLGRRSDRRVPRPLERLAFRARFDLNLAINREGDGLTLERRPIAIDRTPLRIIGRVGTSLYHSARAAGAPVRLVEAYLKALGTRLSIGRDVAAGARFTLVADQARAATGEVELGELQYAALERGRRTVRLVRWDGDAGTGGEWWDADGRTRSRGAMALPVAGRISSTHGMRMHPLLGFMRMHKGVDIAAPHGAPVFAASDGAVAMAGRNAGYGRFVRLAHANGLATGYGHLSRIAVRAGQRVVQGQVIGYVGTTGLSTGPHLHWEVWRNGASVNPRGLSISRIATLTGAARRAFRAKLARLTAGDQG